MARGKRLQILQTSHVLLECVAAGARSCAGEGVGGLHNHSLDAMWFDLIVVRLDRVHNLLALAIATGKERTDLRMGSIDILVGGLANVVQQSGATRDVPGSPELNRNQGSKIGGLNQVAKHVLSVAGAELQLAEQVDQPRMQPVHV